MSLMAHLYGPAARCKPKMMIWRRLVLRFCIRPIDGACAPGHHGLSARVRSHSRLGPEGQTGHLITNALARPFLHLLFPTRRPRREGRLLLWDQLEPSAIPFVSLSGFMRVLRRRAPHNCAPVPAPSRRSVPACWRELRPKRYGAGAERRERARRRSRASASLPAVTE